MYMNIYLHDYTCMYIYLMCIYVYKCINVYMYICIYIRHPELSWLEGWHGESGVYSATDGTYGSITLWFVNHGYI